MRYYKPSAEGENPYIDLSPYKEAVKASDDNLVIDSEEYKVAVVMLYGAINRLFNGPALSWHCNVKNKITVAAVRNLKASGIWVQKGRKAKHELFTKWANSTKDKNFRQSVCFWLDACVAHGSMAKIKRHYGLRAWLEPTYSQKLKSRLKWIPSKVGS